MCEKFVYVNNVPTKLLVYGDYASSDVDSNRNETNDIVLLIPGTVGIPEFYHEFLETIHKETGYAVWTMGHAGHDVHHDLPPLNDDTHSIYGIEGQIQHKIDFIEEYVPKSARIHFVGHSIGSHIILKLMERDSIRKRVVNCFFLFPVMERLKCTRNGKLFRFLKPFIGLILCFTWLFSTLPHQLQLFLLTIYLFLHGRADRAHIDSILTLLDPAVLAKVFYMLYDEMDVVKTKNLSVIVDNVETMRFYYGSSDGWVPKDYCDRLKRDVPQIQAELCTNNYEHHFVLHSSRSVGKMVAAWFEKKR